MAPKSPISLRRYRKGRGLVASIIIVTVGEKTIKEEKGEVNVRHGAWHDILNIEAAFKDVDMDHIYEMDPSAEKINIFIEKVNEQLNSNVYEWLVLCVSSHGNMNVIYGSDGRPVYTNEQIIQKFGNLQCPSLNQRPKVFVFNACRGSDENTKGIIKKTQVNRLKAAAKDSSIKRQFKVLSLPVEIELEKKFKLADQYVIYSTPPGMYSERKQDTGSPLFITLKKCMETWASGGGKKHFKDIVGDIMYEMLNDYEIQIQTDDMMTPQFYLPLREESGKTLGYII